MKRSPMPNRDPNRVRSWQRTSAERAEANRRAKAAQQPRLRRTRLNPMSERKRADGAVYAQARRQVYERSQGMCEGNVEGVCPPLPHAAEHVHHILRRSQGGGHDLGNLAHLCHRVHQWTHDNPAAARTLGLLRSRGEAA